MDSSSRLAVLCAVLLIASPGTGAEQFTVPPDQQVGGYTQGEWSQKWWQWAGAFARNESPVADRSGALCGSRQEGPVWFLAGTYGTKRTIRSCQVPSGRYLFFPLLNYVILPDLERPVSCRDRVRKAAALTDHPSYLVLEIDGVRVENLENYRQAPQNCFDMGVRAEPRVRVFPSAANGYYVMLKPLPPGRHEINFGGILPGMAQAVTYTLEVR